MNKKTIITKNILLLIACICISYIQAAPKIILPLNLNLPDDPFWKEDATEANNNINHCEEAADTVNYADYRYVGAHNAHVYHRFFETVRQQDQTILGHLSYGIRGLMLDTYDFTLGWPASIRGPEGVKVCLSHPEPGFLAFTQKGHNSYQSLAYELRRIIEVMKVAPKIIVTIVLENYANANQTTIEIENVLKAANYDPILKPSDWPNANQDSDQQWPTLGWMRANNKRLVIFTQHGIDTKYTWREFTHCIENQYSTIDPTQLCQQRAESQSFNNLKRKLVIFNNFKGIAVTQSTNDTKNQVTYSMKDLITSCKNSGFANGRLFNGYFADRIVDSCNALYESGQKTIFDYVNELNQKTDKTQP